MKRYLFLSFLALASLFSCSPYPRVSERMAAALEQAEAVYGDSDLLLETDTVLFIPGLSEASVYYARKRQFDKAALAALYNGYAEKDYDKEVAINSFKEAERYGEMVHDSLTVARAEYQLGRMLYYDTYARESLVFFKKANAHLGNRFTDCAFVFNGMAASHILLSEFDSAAICFERSLEYAEIGQCVEAKRKALNNYAVLYRLIGEYGKAIECLRLVQPEDIKGQLLNYLNLGDVFAASHEIDSARHYYQLVESLLEESQVKPETMAAAYNSLAQLAEQDGDWEKALIFRKDYDRLFSEIVDRRRQNRIFYIQKKYDYEALQNQLNMKMAYRRLVITIVSLLLVLVTIAFAISQAKLAKTIKQENEARERVLFYIQQYFEALKKEGDTMRKVAIIMDHKDDRALLNDLKETVFGKRDPWVAIIGVFDKLYPGERNRIRDKYPLLSDLEQKSIILSYFNVSRQDEALLLKISIHSVDKLRQKVKKSVVQEVQERDSVS